MIVVAMVALIWVLEMAAEIAEPAPESQTAEAAPDSRARRRARDGEPS